MKPYIICHMVTSLDGKVTGDFLAADACQKATDVYYELNRNFKAQAFACGSTTMISSFTFDHQPDLSPFADAKISREDYVADPSATYFAVSFDRRGRVGWQESRIHDEDPGYDDAHIIEVVSPAVSDAYLAYLQSMGVSYIIYNSLPEVLEKLRRLFGIELLLLEGGSEINGAFHHEGLIDELSLVVAPITAKAEDKPLFWQGNHTIFTLKDVKQQENCLHLRYKKEDKS